MHRLLNKLLAPVVQQITGAALQPDGTVTMPLGQQTNASLRAQIAALQLEVAQASQLLLLTQEQVTTQGQLLTTEQHSASQMGGRITTLQQLTDSYSAALASSLADWQTLHAADATNLTVDAQQQQAIANSTQALAALMNRLRGVRVPLPAMPLAGPATLTVTWPTPFADDAYTIAGMLSSTGVLKVRMTRTGQTAAGCTLQLENLGLANLLSGAGSLHLIALHD